MKKDNAAPSEYEYDYDDIANEAAGRSFEVPGDGENGGDGNKGKRFGGGRGLGGGDEDEEEQEESAPSFMLFDFRRGQQRWPANVELLSPETAEALIAKKKEAAAKEQGGAGGKKKVDTTGISSSGGGGRRDGMSGGSGKMEGFGNTDASYDVMFPENFRPGGGGGDSDSGSDDDDDFKAKDGEEEEDSKRSPAPTGAVFETLKDGSTALVVQAGWRLKLDLNELLDGGDENKPARDAKKRKQQRDAKKRAKKRAGGGGGGSGGGVSFGGGGSAAGGGGGDGYAADNDGGVRGEMSANDPWGTGATYGKGGTGGGGGTKWFKDTMGSWTVTMDVKVGEGSKIPREGMSLVHTALVHSEETKGGRTKLKPTEGEAIINSDGGVGQLGTFGE